MYNSPRSNSTLSRTTPLIPRVWVRPLPPLPPPPSFILSPRTVLLLLSWRGGKAGEEGEGGYSSTNSDKSVIVLFWGCVLGFPQDYAPVLSWGTSATSNIARSLFSLIYYRPVNLQWVLSPFYLLSPSDLILRLRQQTSATFPPLKLNWALRSRRKLWSIADLLAPYRAAI